MKLIYILSQGHSGSTLTDSILGTHPDFISSGELRYLNWQLARTKGVKATVSAQNICSCEQDFRECEYWSQVFELILKKTGNDIVSDPLSFNTAFFGKFAYKNRNGFTRNFLEKVKGYFFRKWLEKGNKLNKIDWLEPKVNSWIKNNWLLYETMAEVAKRPIVVDSSKDLLIALLMQQYKPDDVHILFLHRSVKGLASSYKKWSEKAGNPFSISTVIQSKQKFENRVKKYKKIKNLKYLDDEYEQIVKNPADFVSRVVRKTGAKLNYDKQLNNQFYIDPSKQHLVAGNPMRYRRKQLVSYDASWKKNLTESEINELENCIF
jgi:hypothetical protein